MSSWVYMASSSKRGADSNNPKTRSLHQQEEEQEDDHESMVQYYEDDDYSCSVYTRTTIPEDGVVAPNRHYSTHHDENDEDGELFDPAIVATLENRHRSGDSGGGTSASTSTTPQKSNKRTLPTLSKEINTSSREAEVEPNTRPQSPAEFSDDDAVSDDGTLDTAQFSTVWRGLSMPMEGSRERFNSLESLEQGSLRSILAPNDEDGAPATQQLVPNDGDDAIPTARKSSSHVFSLKPPPPALAPATEKPTKTKEERTRTSSLGLEAISTRSFPLHFSGLWRGMSSSSSHGTDGRQKKNPAVRLGSSSDNVGRDLEEGSIKSIDKAKHGEDGVTAQKIWKEPIKADDVDKDGPKTRPPYWLIICGSALVLVMAVVLAVVVALLASGEGFTSGGEQDQLPETIASDTPPVVPAATDWPTPTKPPTTAPPSTTPPSTAPPSPSQAPVDGTAAPTSSESVTTTIPSADPTLSPSTAVPVSTSFPTMAPTTPSPPSTSLPTGDPTLAPTIDGSSEGPSDTPTIVPYTQPGDLFPITCTNDSNDRVRVFLDNGNDAVRRCSKISRDPPLFCPQPDQSDNHLADDGTVPFVWQVCQIECEEWALGEGNVQADYPEYIGCPVDGLGI